MQVHVEETFNKERPHHAEPLASEKAITSRSFGSLRRKQPLVELQGSGLYAYRMFRVHTS